MTEAPAVAKPAAGPFRPGVVLALILAAVFSMSAMAVMSAWSPELSDGNDGRDHALSKSAIGYGGLVRLLRGMDRTVVLSRGGLRGGGGDSLLILTPPTGREEKAMAALTRGRGDVLIVLPKWQTAPDPVRKGWVRALGPLPAQAALSVLPADMREGVRFEVAEGQTSVRLMQGSRLVGDGPRIAGLRTLSGPGWTPVITDQAGRPLLLVHDRSARYVLTDPDLLNTLGLNDPAKARTAVAIIDIMAAGDRSIVFDLSLNGFSRPRSIMRLLLEPPLLGFTLCLFVAVLLIGWQAMVRFEPHLNAGRAIPPGKTALADNTAALARLARREHRMARPYAEVVRGLAARAVSAPHALGAEALTKLLNRLAARHGDRTTWEDLLARAEAARTPADLMSVAGALIRWKSEMTRGRD